MINKEIKSLIEEVKIKKRNLLVMKLKKDSGELDSLKNAKLIKKEIARLFTKMNMINS